MEESKFKNFLIDELTKFKNETDFERKKEIIKKIDEVLFREYVIPKKRERTFNDEILDAWEGTLLQVHDYGIERIITEQEILDMLEDLKQNKVNYNNLGKYWKLKYD
ncbi:MAG: hypothetical protein D6733_07585 [Methanobacteriota archaeon]|nr:MAG: hypothetical protein D6733_07585 [Euryarchaeota archaeon]